jgi:GNAT superfamily N-acetyltransferase
VSVETAARRSSRSRLRRRADKAFGLLRAGEWRLVLNTLRKWLYSDSCSYGLCRDLTGPMDVPEPAISLTIRPIERSDVLAFTETDPARHDRPSARHRSAAARLLASDIQTCYVAVTDEGATCYMQYLILASENDKVQAFFEGTFPRLAEDQALLEGALTLEEYRGRGIMPFVMEDLAGKARNEGARRLVTFVSSENVPALKGCQRAGFVPYMLVNRRFRLFMRRISFMPLPEGTRYPFEEGGGPTAPSTANGASRRSVPAP